MFTAKNVALMTLVLMLTCLPAAAQTNEQLLETIEKNLPAARTFQYGQPNGPLMEIERAVFALPAASDLRASIEQKLIEALTAAETNDARQFLCTQLRVVGTDKCVPSLAKLLTDPETSSMAIYALGRLETVAASKALYEAMGSTKEATQAGIINALADRGYQEAGPDLLKLLQSTDSEAVKRACARALGRLGGSDAIDLLLAACDDAQDAFLALELQNALLEASDTMRAAGDPSKAAAVYAAIIELKPASQTHLAALRGLVLAQPSKGSELLVAEISKSDPPLSRDAIGLTALVPGQKATRAFADLLGKLQATEQVLMIRALGHRGDALASTALVAAASNSDESVRLAALEALGRAGDAAAVQVLVEAAKGDKGGEWRVAQRSLQTLPVAQAYAELAKILAGDDAAGAAVSAQAMAARGHTQAVPQLLTLAQSDWQMVRHEAIKAVGALGSNQDLKPLIDLAIESASAADQPVFLDAIANVLARIDSEDDRVAPLLTALKSAPQSAKPTLLLLLGKTGSTKALPVIRSGLTKDKLPSEREAATHALAQWPDANVVDDLLYVITTVREQSHKEIALTGYIRLANLSDDPTAMLANVLQQIERTADKKMVLEGLGLSADSPAAMNLAKQYLSEPDLSPAAGLATLRIAHRLRNSDTKLARAALDQVIQTVNHDDVRRRAQEVINDIDKFADHILDWVGAGPFTEKGKDGAAIYQIAFAPENPNAVDVKWKPITSGVGIWDINLESTFGGLNHCAAYLRTRVWSPETQEALLEMGSDDAVKTWLNGQLVFNKWTVQGASPRQHRVNVPLKKGWNILMLKVVDVEGGWVVGCRLRALDGSALGGLKVSVE